MNITIINGSPKGKNSTSQFLADKLSEYISETHNLSACIINTPVLKDSHKDLLLEADILVFFFPLYIDAIPSHLFRLLPQMQELLKDQDKTVYGFVNCGFYEGYQTSNALSVLQNWCLRTSLRWGQGIGCGGGEMIQFNKSIPFGHGPFANHGKAFESFGKNISENKQDDAIFFSPNFPRFGYQIASKFYKWYPLLWKNKIMPWQISS